MISTVGLARLTSLAISRRPLGAGRLHGLVALPHLADQNIDKDPGTEGQGWNEAIQGRPPSGDNSISQRMNICSQRDERISDFDQKLISTFHGSNKYSTDRRNNPHAATSAA